MDPGCKGAFQVGEQVTNGLLRPRIKSRQFPNLESLFDKASTFNDGWMAKVFNDQKKWGVIALT